MTTENYEELTPEAPADVSAPEEAPASDDVSFTEISPEPVEADPAADPAPDPAPAPDPEPVEPSAPVEVVTVDDLLDRLTEESQEEVQTEELPQEEEAVTDYVPEFDLPAAQVEGGPLEVIGMEILLNRLEAIQQQTDEHPMMETPFEDYTVTEGLMLLIFVILLLDFFLNILRRWF